MRLAIALLVASLSGVGGAQQPQLRIVVLDGEGAVNIIQQKTAVRALVEVRDRNNLPASGATVTFAVTGKGGATVAGAQTVTVTTNAAGQAALSGMSPATSGGLQISVNATYNGLSAATTITQTVVATVAAAAAAATAGAVAGTGAVAGGGLSTGAILGIVGGVAAVGGGVAVAGGGGGSDDRDDSSAMQPLPTCAFSVTPTTLTVPIEGGSFVVNVAMTPASCALPQWHVDVGLASHFVSANPTSGTGSGSTTITVAPFSPTPSFPTRTGAVGVADTVVHIHQPRPIG